MFETTSPATESKDIIIVNSIEFVGDEEKSAVGADSTADDLLSKMSSKDQVFAILLVQKLREGIAESFAETGVS